MQPASQTLDFDAVIVGGGSAALVAALEARKSLGRVAVVGKRRPGRSGNTVVAQAGFAACVVAEDNPDTAEQHLRDTMVGGADLNDPALVRALTSDAGEAVMGLQQYGVRFARADGSLIRRMPPGHSLVRSFSTDSAGLTNNTRGLAITLPLLRAAEERGIRVLSDVPIHRLLVRDGVVFGARGVEARSGAEVTLRAGAVVLAAGGGGHLFASTNNTLEMTGDSFALALESGVALRDMEFVQFYPFVTTAPVHTTISNSVARDGAVLRNLHGEQFMHRYDPVNGELATRDVLSRAVFLEAQSGNGVGGGVYLDCTGIPGDVLEKKFRSLVELMRGHSIDLSKQWLVVAPTTHFFMGGAWIDANCRTNVEGLFVAGEAAGGIHGANRLPGNALTEAVVFGARAGREAAAYARGLAHIPEAPAARLDVPADPSGSLSPGEVKAEVRRTMWANASIVRDGEGLRRAEASLRECQEALPRCRVETPAQLVAYLEVERMVLAGRTIVASALRREESRGAHYRTDCPTRDDGRWLGSVRVQKSGDSLDVSFVQRSPL